MIELGEPNFGDTKENLNKEIYRLLVFYRQLTELLEMCFSGYLIIVTKEINRSYLRLCNKVRDFLKKPGLEDLAQRHWQPFNNLMSLDPDAPGAEWEYRGRQICGNFLSGIEEIFIGIGEKTYPLDSEDQQLLTYIQTYLEKYRGFKRSREKEWLREGEKQAEEWKKKQGKPQVKVPKFDFEFVRDEEIKSLLIKDWGEAQKAFQNELYKSTVLLSGTILESLLIDALYRIEADAKFNYYQKYVESKERRGKAPEIEDWRLYQLIEIAKQQGIISSDVAKFSDLVRDYRNLIHLWVQKREGLQLDSNIATAIVSLLTIAYNNILNWHEKKRMIKDH